eukprot:1033869-Prymnesium_polylepis.1
MVDEAKPYHVPRFRFLPVAGYRDCSYLACCDWRSNPVTQAALGSAAGGLMWLHLASLAYRLR